MIDWDRVRELQEELGEDEFDPVLELFLDELEEVAMRLNGRTSNDLESDLHFLKGCALNLGLREFSIVCSVGEKETHAGRPVDIGALLASYGDAKRALVGGLHLTRREADVA